MDIFRASLSIARINNVASFAGGHELPSLSAPVSLGETHSIYRRAGRRDTSACYTFTATLASSLCQTPLGRIGLVMLSSECDSVMGGLHVRTFAQLRVTLAEAELALLLCWSI